MTDSHTGARDIAIALALSILCAATILVGIAPRLTALMGDARVEHHVGALVLGAPNHFDAAMLRAVAAGPGRLQLHVVAGHPGAYRMQFEAPSTARCIARATLSVDGQTPTPMSVTRAAPAGVDAQLITASVDLNHDARQLTIALSSPPGCEVPEPGRLSFTAATSAMRR